MQPKALTPIHSQVKMKLEIGDDKRDVGAGAAAQGAERIREALERHGEASIVLATGASQFEMLDSLVRQQRIDWGRISAFHLDEYVGISEDHPASFRRYLKERFVDRLPTSLRTFHWIRGDADARAECERLGRLIGEIDVAFVGIGENGHLAFNDPPADFETEEPYLVVELDEACRRQQLNEGWFGSLDQVPHSAISMSIRQIMSAITIICTVPDERKARAVRAAIEGPVTPQVPASILQRHGDCRVFLDPPAASMLERFGAG
jgi:glucosamine-6-phosphate deaminase